VPAAVVRPQLAATVHKAERVYAGYGTVLLLCGTVERSDRSRGGVVEEELRVFAVACRRKRLFDSPCRVTSKIQSLADRICRDGKWIEWSGRVDSCVGTRSHDLEGKGGEIIRWLYEVGGVVVCGAPDVVLRAYRGFHSLTVVGWRNFPFSRIRLS
jgi:hypothetical protein